MGHRRPRTLLLGLVVALAAFWGQQAAGGSQPASARVLHGGVSASGQAPESPDWQLEHPEMGTYRIVFSAADVDLDVSEWDQAADVTIVPLGNGTVEIRFTQGRDRVDSAFAFVAMVQD